MNTNDPTNIPAPSFTADLQAATKSLRHVAAMARTHATGDAVPTPLTVADLSAKHIGKRIRVADQGNTFTGFVEDIEYEVERLMRGNDAVGVRVIFDRASILYPLKATVTVET